MEFGFQYRDIVARHAEQRKARTLHPQMHRIVKAEHELGGRRLRPRKADLRRRREHFADYMTEFGVPAAATVVMTAAWSRRARRTPYVDRLLGG